MADPDLQIRGWEGGCGHPDPEIGGQMVSKKFSWASVWSKIKGGGVEGRALPLDPPLQSVWRFCMWIFKGLNYSYTIRDVLMLPHM